MDNFNILRTLKFLPGIIIGLTIHEFSHAFVAHMCGDTTSRDQGRITLNPFKHIDPLGFIMLLVVGFGWAKPVEFNEQNLRNPKADTLKIAVSGPISNALLAMFLTVIFAILYRTIDFPYYSLATELFIYAIYINWGLFIFNLLPVPPLDGSHLLLSFFKKYPVLYNGLYKYGSYLFLGIIVISMVTSLNLLPIWPVIQFFGNGFLSLFGFNMG